jgi:HSP20 family protein
MVLRIRDPFATLLGLQDAMEQARRSDWFGPRTSGRGAYPPVNVFRQNDDFVMVMEIPGVKKEDLDIQVKDKEVRIRGKKSIEYADDVSVHRRERLTGQFDRTLSLPSPIDPDRAKAEYRDGVLALHLTRAESDKPRSIAIQ